MPVISTKLMEYTELQTATPLPYA